MTVYETFEMVVCPVNVVCSPGSEDTLSWVDANTAAWRVPRQSQHINVVYSPGKLLCVDANTDCRQRGGYLASLST